MSMYYTWHKKAMEWLKGLRGGHNFNVRIGDVPPRYREVYYLRLLLHHVRGPASFEDDRTVAGTVHETFRSACAVYCLLVSDSQHVSTLTEAARLKVPSSLRLLFVHVVVYCRPNNVRGLYLQFEKDMQQDWIRVTGFATRARAVGHNLLAKYFNQLEANSLDYGLHLDDAMNPDLCPELLQLTTEDRSIELPTLQFNREQSVFFDAIKESIDGEQSHSQSSRAYLLDGLAGTRKTYTINDLIGYAYIHGSVVVASWLEIAASLLSGGMTLHSLLKLGFDLDHMSVVGLHLQSFQAMRLTESESSLIVTDEVSMANKHAVRALDDFLREATGNHREVFGGKTVVLAGDFRQILPVVKTGVSSSQIVKTLPLWSSVKQMQLTTNLRMKDDPQYAQFVLNVGNGVELDRVCVPDKCVANTLYQLIMDTLGPIPSHHTLILAATNKDVNIVNDIVSSSVGGEERIYLSVDTYW